MSILESYKKRLKNTSTICSSHQLIKELGKSIFFNCLENDLRKSTGKNRPPVSVTTANSPRHFIVLVIGVRDEAGINTEVSPIQNLLDEMGQACNDPLEIHSVSCVGTNKLMMLLSCSSESAIACEQLVEKTMIQLRDRLFSRFNLYIMPFGGTVCEDFAQVEQAFMKAIEASSFRGASKQEPVIWHNRIPQAESRYSFPLETEERLMIAVRAANVDETDAILNEVFRDNFENLKLSPTMVDLLVKELIATSVKLLNIIHSHIDPSQLLCIELVLQQLEEVLYIEDFFENLLEIYHSLCKFFGQRKHSHNKQLAEKILRYIQSTYMQPDICLWTVADRFKISREYLSQFFKEQIGENFSAHLTKLRVQKAKALLERTDVSLGEIAERVGYTSSVTFRRAFKRITRSNPRDQRNSLRNTHKQSDGFRKTGAPVINEFILASSEPPGGIVENALSCFADRVFRSTKGKYKICIYPTRYSGYDTKLLELLSAGGIDFVMAGCSIFGNHLKEMSLLAKPYLVRTLQEGWDFYDNSFWIRRLFKEIESSGFKILGTIERGFRCLTTRSPSIHPKDLQCLKIRVPPNPLHILIWKNIGAVPIPMEIQDIYEALQKGVIDGQENPIDTIWTHRFYEVASHITLTRHVYSPFLLSASTKAWTRMSNHDHEAICEAAVDACRYSRRLVNEEELSMIHHMKKLGAKIYYPNIQEWQDAMQNGIDELEHEFNGHDDVMPY